MAKHTPASVNRASRNPYMGGLASSRAQDMGQYGMRKVERPMSMLVMRDPAKRKALLRTEIDIVANPALVALIKRRLHA